MSRIRRMILGATMTSATVATVVACSDDPSAPRASFDAADATPDVPKPDLPKPADDASTGTNDAAADAREPFNPADGVVTCPTTGACAKEIVAGRNHFCARLADGTVHCWGDPEYGALGGEEARRRLTVSPRACGSSAGRCASCARIPARP